MKEDLDYSLTKQEAQDAIETINLLKHELLGLLARVKEIIPANEYNEEAISCEETFDELVLPEYNRLIAAALRTDDHFEVDFELPMSKEMKEFRADSWNRLQANIARRNAGGGI